MLPHFGRRKEQHCCDGNAESTRRNLRRWITVATAMFLIACRYDSLMNLSRSLQSNIPLSSMIRESESAMPLPMCTTRNDVTSIRSYLALMERPEDWILFKWNANGTFDHEMAQAKTQYQQWKTSPDIFGDAEPSDFGRVVLFLVSDRLPLVPWNVRPPVPVWVFSMPTSEVDPRIQNISNPPKPCELERITVVPTPYDTGNWNKHCVETVARSVKAHNFTEKINKVVWRGVIHSDRVEKSRLAAVELARQHANDTWLDIQYVGNQGKEGRMEMHELAEYRYHLDLGGLSGTAWGGLRWKLCSGLLVFKVDSWANDWWYDSLEPWKHYIPVRADVSDLTENYQWTQDHPDETQQIAEAGRQKCLETIGPQNAQAQYRTIVQEIPAADEAIMKEADQLLEQLSRLQADMGEIIPSITTAAG